MSVCLGLWMGVCDIPVNLQGVDIVLAHQLILLRIGHGVNADIVLVPEGVETKWKGKGTAGRKGK